MSLVGKFKNAMGLGDEDEDIYDDEDIVDEYEYEDSKKSVSSIFSSKREERSSYDTRPSGKVVSIHDNRTTVNILKPADFDESPSIANSLKDGQILLINTTGMEKKVAQRLLDFVSGACYALGGDVSEVESGVFVFSPSSVHVEATGAKNKDARGFINWSTL